MVTPHPAHPLGPGLTLVRSPKALARRTLDTVLVLGSTASEPVRLEGSATLLWALLAQPISIRDIIETLAEHFGVPHDQIRDDLVIPFERLMIVGALEVV